MRPWQAILLILALLFFAISSGWSPLYKLTYVLLTLFVLSWVWARYSLRKLTFHRNTTSGRVQVGETFEERLMLDNTSVLPKLWVQIVDGSTLPGHRAGYVASMGGRKRAVWKARTVCKRRGRFQLGPVTASSGDPFGLFRRHIALTPAHELLVLPRVLPITNFTLFTGGLPGRGRSSQRSLQTTTNATTIRDYLAGDALSRIHWRSSAHNNKLMVKEFDLDPSVDAWIILDLHDAVQAGQGEHNGQRREFLSLDRGNRQIERVLELLAVVTSGPGPDLKEALALDALHFGRNTVAIVITPSSSRDWHEGLRHLQRRGVKVAVVGLDAASFDDSPPDEDTLALLEGASIPVARVKRGDSLIHVLESSHEARFALRR